MSDELKPIGQVRVEANGEWILKGWSTKLPEGVHWIYAHPVSSPPQNDAGVEGLREALLEKATWFRCCPSTGEYSGEYCSVRPADDHNMVPMIGVEAVLRILHPMLGQEFEAGWRRIETAPKDGTPFLAGRSGSDVGAVVVARSRPRWPGLYSVPGDYSLKWPTHWLPLPSAPSGEG